MREKIIRNFQIDTSDIKASGETRQFVIAGDKGAIFSLEIKSGNNYYNFQTNLFQTTETKLSNITMIFFYMLKLIITLNMLNTQRLDLMMVL